MPASQLSLIFRVSAPLAPLASFMSVPAMAPFPVTPFIALSSANFSGSASGCKARAVEDFHRAQLGGERQRLALRQSDACIAAMHGHASCGIALHGIVVCTASKALLPEYAVPHARLRPGQSGICSMAGCSLFCGSPEQWGQRPHIPNTVDWDSVIWVHTVLLTPLPD